MGRAIAEGRDFPLFFWGQRYLGTVTAMLAALIGWGRHVGPLELRAAAALEVAGGLVFFWLGLRQAVGRRPAMVTALWLAAGPPFLFHFTIAPLGGQLFLAGGALFWCATRPRINWFVFGVLSGVGWWMHQGVVFVLLPALAVILVRERRIRLLPFASGFLLGHIPAILGYLRPADQRLYAPIVPSWTLTAIGHRIADTLEHDWWALLAGEQHLLTGIAITIAFLIGLRNLTLRRATLIAAGVIITSLAFWMFSTFAFRGAVRYIVVAVPPIYAFAAGGLLRFRPAISIAAIALIAASLAWPRVTYVREVVAGRGEQYEHWPGAFDPRPVLREIQQYEICYGDFWVAYKLQFLSDPEVKFIPYRSVNRTMSESWRLARTPGPKCYVTLDGAVRRLSPAEEIAFRNDTARLIAGRHQP
jgi:hypothetical protein